MPVKEALPGARTPAATQMEGESHNEGVPPRKSQGFLEHLAFFPPTPRRPSSPNVSSTLASTSSSTSSLRALLLQCPWSSFLPIRGSWILR
jgi:hypothetical protein